MSRSVRAFVPSAYLLMLPGCARRIVHKPVARLANLTPAPLDLVVAEEHALR